MICGHIHTPKIRNLNGVVYYNTGDWVESCTALVEYSDGSLELLYRPLNTAVDSGDPSETGPDSERRLQGNPVPGFVSAAVEHSYVDAPNAG